MTTAIHVAGWTLVHFVWQGTAIALAAAVILHVLRHGSPRARYAVSCVALTAMLAVPAATAWRLSTAGPESMPAVHRSLFLRVTPSALAQHDTVMVRARHAAPVLGLGHPGGDARGPAWPLLMPMVVAIWSAGVCLLMVRVAGGWRRVRGLHRSARARPASAWQAACATLVRRLGLTRDVRVVEAAGVDSPLVIGWLQPIVLLPIAALSSLTPEQVQAILAHELAHVRRHDAAVNLGQIVAETLLFYHPGVWWLSSRIRVERELCCDDIALEVAGDALVYASALAELESARANRPTFALAANGGSLVHRVARLLAPPPVRSGSGAMLTVALVAVFVMGAGALQYLVARQPPAQPAGGAGRQSPAAWRMVFDHPSGQLVIRGFTARDLVRYAYQVPVSQVVGGPAWLDADAFDLATTVEHVPAADETPDLVRQLLEERFALRVHESTVDVPVLALEIARADGALGPSLQPATGECFDQQAWLAAGAPPLHASRGEHTQFCGVWDDGVGHQRVLSVTMDAFAASMRHRFAPAVPLDVVDHTELRGAFDVSLEFFKPAAAAMAVTPSLRAPLRLAGFSSVTDALEEQLGLRLVPSTAPARAIVIDRVRRPFPDVAIP